jgi:hypothetical protein
MSLQWMLLGQFKLVVKYKGIQLYRHCHALRN